MEQTATTKPEHIIPFWEKFMFALGDFAANLIWMPMAIFLNPYITEVCKIDAQKAGIVVLIVRLFDLVIDVGIGIIGDGSNPRWKNGKFRTYMIWGAIPLAIAGALMFRIPQWNETAKLIYLGVAYFVLSVAYSITNVPYSAQMSIASPDHKERTSLAAFRMVGAQVGVLFISMFMTYLVDKLGGGNPYDGYFYTMSLLGVIIASCLIAAAKSSKDRIITEPVPIRENLKNVVTVVTCRLWWILLVMGLFTTFALTIRFGTIPYFIKYYLTKESLAPWGGEGWMISFFYTSGTVCALIGSALYGLFSKKFDKKVVFLVFIILTGISSFMFSFIPRDGALMLMVMQIIFSLLMGPTGAIMFATYTDVAAFLRHKHNKDLDGVAMAVNSVCNKSGWSIGPSLTLIVLGVVKYSPNVEQTGEVLTALQWMVGVGPAIACGIAFFAMLVYPLTAKRMDVIQEELSQRGSSQTP
jgi:GPH family glycoside/pentoside/hexuronide:cation symporter